MKTGWAGPLFLLLTPLLVADQEGPGRGVARVSLMNGDVVMQRGDSGDWIAAAVNAPLVTGDKISAARASRAEVQLDYANFLRIGENTEVRLADLEGRRYQLQVSRGLMTYRILRDSAAEVEINTPAVAVRPLKHGAYRVQVLENGQTEITVRDGKAEISSRQGTETLHSGRMLVVRLGATDSEIQVQELRAASRDDWDHWNERRDHYLSRSRSYGYVHSSIYGAEDLDDYGYWRPIPGYGPCWFPRVAVGWAPYSFGRWVWVDWYGWTWVAYEPWGWAPFHYGRWFHRTGFGWGWYPGPIYARSYWAPALVGFFGFGRHSGFGIGVGFGFGRIGWVPLAPGEAFHPWYGRGYYGRRTNVFVDNSVHITNITNVRNVYRNAGVNGGVVSVDAPEFGRRSIINPQRVSATEIRNAGQIRGLIPVVPDRQSLRVTDRDARTAAVARSDGREDRFFMRRQPAPVERVPFSEQQQQIARSVRARTGVEDRRTDSAAGPGITPAGAPTEGRRSIRELGEAGPTERSGRITTQGNSSAEVGRGWRGVGEERRPAAATGPGAAPPTERSTVDRGAGWRRFGEGRRSAPEAAAAPTQSRVPSTGERTVDRGSGFRRLGEERRSAPASITPPADSPSPSGSAGERTVDRGAGWRRLGEGRRSAPESFTAPTPAAPSSTNERNLDRGSGFRRLGEERRSAPESIAPPSSERNVEGRGSVRGGQPRNEAPASIPRFGGRTESEMQRRNDFDGGRSIRGLDHADRQLEIRRPITVERAPRHEGGRAAPAPVSRSEGSRGDGDRGGRHVERSGGSRR